MKLYKLTNQDNFDKSLQNFKWGEGVEHDIKDQIIEKNGVKWIEGIEEKCHKTMQKIFKEDPKHLDGVGLIRASVHPVIPTLVKDRTRKDLEPFKLWECEGDIEIRTIINSVKCSRLKTIKEIDFPAISNEEKVKFVVLLGKKGSTNERWLEFVDKWLKGENIDTSFSSDFFSILKDKKTSSAEHMVFYVINALGDPERDLESLVGEALTWTLAEVCQKGKELSYEEIEEILQEAIS